MLPEFLFFCIILCPKSALDYDEKFWNVRMTSDIFRMLTTKWQSWITPCLLAHIHIRRFASHFMNSIFYKSMFSKTALHAKYIYNKPRIF